MPKGTKILMVDDDKMLIDLYKERLELAGYQVEVSRDGEEGLAKIHTVKPDLVLLDIMMPKVNGYEALASIKSDPATKDVPVIILSALMRDVNKSKAVESGADDYIIKSEAMPADVIQKIEAVLKKYHKETPPTTPAAPPPVVSPAPPGPPPAPPAPSTPLVINPPAEPPAPPTTPRPPGPPQEIQFEPFDSAPSKELGTSQGKPASPSIGGTDLAPKQPPASPAENPISPPPAPNAVPITPPAPQVVPAPKANPLVVFFLILICILILSSDLFFYMKYITGK